MKGKSFARTYIKDSKEGMPLERFLERRRSTLENWVIENNIKTIVQAEERAKSMGLMITLQVLMRLEEILSPPTKTITKEEVQQDITQETSQPNLKIKKRREVETPEQSSIIDTNSN
jgi:hypothetical protein